VHQDFRQGLRTKELLEMTGISEPTLRRWLRDGHPVPELVDARRDWRGWRTWESRHVDAIRRYQRTRQEGSRAAEGQHLAKGKRQ
jgi:predicted site-specific integrase-resolvase